MKIAQINILCNGSTGKIMMQIAKAAQASGHETRMYTPVQIMRSKKVKHVDIPGHYIWGSRMEMNFHNYAGVLLGLNGFFSRRGTRQLIKDLKKFNPDVIHLHNFHRFCLHMPSFFRYLKTSGAQVVWTLHDCWAFTGHCPYFDMVQCDKWKTGCHHCPQPRIYPKMFLDTSKRMYGLKKDWFCGIENMTLVTPSDWLAKLVKQSFLREYPTCVIHNGIDLSVFQPIESDFRQKHGLEGKNLILGVSFAWGKRKGLDVFLELAKRLDNSYRIVLVGTNDIIDQQLPEEIISIHSTDNQRELAQIYTAADVFVNPTREDNFPTVNIEALACGIPVVTFHTGGSIEIPDETCGAVVEQNDVDALARQICRSCSQTPYSKEACVARAQKFDMYTKFKEYVDLYEDCTHRTERSI